LYDLIAKKVIINRDVQFLENEAWDGSIERIVRIIDSMGHDDMEDQVVQTPSTSQCTIPSTPETMTQITTQTTLVRSVGVQSTPRVQQTPKNS
jgi:hypothetical protein